MGETGVIFAAGVGVVLLLSTRRRKLDPELASEPDEASKASTDQETVQIADGQTSTEGEHA